METLNVINSFDNLTSLAIHVRNPENAFAIPKMVAISFCTEGVTF